MIHSKKLHCDCCGQNKTQIMVKFHFPLGDFGTQLKNNFLSHIQRDKTFLCTLYILGFSVQVYAL